MKPKKENCLGINPLSNKISWLKTKSNISMYYKNSLRIKLLIYRIPIEDKNTISTQ